jgi:hypothetical protein
MEIKMRIRREALLINVLPVISMRGPRLLVCSIQINNIPIFQEITTT